jgi:hypothetical protein
MLSSVTIGERQDGFLVRISVAIDFATGQEQEINDKPISIKKVFGQTI